MKHLCATICLAAALLPASMATAGGKTATPPPQTIPELVFSTQKRPLSELMGAFFLPILREEVLYHNRECPLIPGESCMILQRPLQGYMPGRTLGRPWQEGEIIAHEYGHAIDFVLDEEGSGWRIRQRFLEIVGLPLDTDWDATDGHGGSPAEMWADLYAVCAWRGFRSVDPVRTGYNYIFSGRTFGRVCALFGRRLKGPLFIQPHRRPTMAIPRNRPNNPGCGTRRSQLKLCTPRA